MKIKVLFVCLGNICRSPAAEAIFLSLLNSMELSDKYEVDSAGTGSWHIGSKADGRMIKTALSRGIMINSYARQIKVDDLTKFDYILTMDNDNLEAVKSLIPTNVIKDNIATIKPVLSYLKQGEIIEVPDPYYGGENGFENVMNLLEKACKSFLDDIKK